jgi:hypothetical protein
MPSSASVTRREKRAAPIANDAARCAHRILAKQLAAVLAMILVHRFDMSAGSRYTFITLTTYRVVTVGVLLVLRCVSLPKRPGIRPPCCRVRACNGKT